MKLEGNLAVLVELISRARNITKPDGHSNCKHCLHDVEVCDCDLSGLRDCVGAWDEAQRTTNPRIDGT